VHLRSCARRRQQPLKIRRYYTTPRNDQNLTFFPGAPLIFQDAPAQEESEIFGSVSAIPSATNAGIAGWGKVIVPRPWTGVASALDGPEDDRAYWGIGRGPEQQPTAAWNIGFTSVPAYVGQ